MSRLDSIDPCNFRSLVAFVSTMTVCLVAGCGGGTHVSTTGPVQGENTTVTVLISSTANDKLAQMDLFLNSIALNTASGQSVSLLAAPQQAEFMHLNGTAEPLATVTAPQATYTSATVTVGAASFQCITWNAANNGAFTSTVYLYGYTPDNMVTVNLPAAVSIDGANMGLRLDLAMSESVTYPSCYQPQAADFSITPTFNVTPVEFVSQPSSVANGKMTGLSGLVSSVDASGGGFVVAALDGPAYEILNGATFNSTGIVWKLETNSGTTFEGVSGIGSLVAGMPVNIDAEMQPDGSLLATRVSVWDLDTANLSVAGGPLLEVPSSGPLLISQGDLEAGPLFASGQLHQFLVSDVGAQFQISGEMTNLATLPFQPSFNSSNVVAGQNVFLTSHSNPCFENCVPPGTATATLMPQTIDGTVQSVSTSGGFMIYTVALAAYDLFPTLAFTDAYQTSPLTSPGTVYVYAATNTQMANTTPASAGSVLRFTGLVFNDQGTLRMDCGTVLDGVAE